MNPGQRRGYDRAGARAHATCVVLVDGQVRFEDLDEVRPIMEAVDAGRHKDVLAAVAAITDDQVRLGIAEAVESAIPSKATLLRAMMDKTADKLTATLAREHKRNYPDTLTVSALAEARTMLQTLAIYVMDEPGGQ